MNCTKYLEGSISNYNLTTESWDNETESANKTKKDYIFDTTEWISYDLAPSSRYCTGSMLEMYRWGLKKSTQFKSWGDVFQAWLQNILGNVITFQKLYDKIKQADQAQNTKESYYWYGRFLSLFINFEPIPEDDEALDRPNQKLFTRFVSERNARTSRVESPRVQGIMGYSLGFASGYVNASLGNASPQSQICQGNLTRIVKTSGDFWDQMD